MRYFIVSFIRKFTHFYKLYDFVADSTNPIAYDTYLISKSIKKAKKDLP